MFPRNRVTGVVGNTIRTQSLGSNMATYTSGRKYSENKTNVTAGLGGFSGTPGASSSMSVNSFWTSQYQYYMTGLIPGEPNYQESSQLALFFRDIYLYDSVAGSVVDILSTFPFSQFDLRGLEENELDIFRDATDQLNVKQLMPIISTAYLVDGFYAGSLVFDNRQKRFLDILVHDALSCQVIPNSFHNLMPTINVITGHSTERLLNSDSQYTKEYLNSLPPAFIEMLKQGSFTLNPINTLFVARRNMTDRAYVSFMHRILPMYLIEKQMFRGTLVEASRRQRAMTHITSGDDVWTPTAEEMEALVSAFQQAEFDPLGGWISTRSSVQVNDVRCIGGNNLINTETGLIKIKDMVKHDPYIMDPGTCVEVNFNVKNHTGNYAPVKYWWFQGIKPTFDITLDDKTILNATENHKWITVDAGAKLSLVKTSELDESTWLLKPINVVEIEKLDLTYGIPANVITDTLLRREIGTRNQVCLVNGIKKRGCLFKDDDGNNVFIDGGWRELFKVFLKSSTKKYPDSRSFFSYANYDSGLYNEHLVIIRRISKTLYINVIKLFTNRYLFCKISSVTQGKEQPVYDLTMSESVAPIFTVNGVLSKNSGGDFWRWDQMVDIMVPYKMRALGVSESLLSGDASYACLVGNTLISLSDGSFRTIEELCPVHAITSELPIGKWYDLNLELPNRLVRDAKTKAWAYQGYKETFTITTEDGSTITATENHPFWTMNSTANEYCWKRLDELKEGDLIAIQDYELNQSKAIKISSIKNAGKQHVYDISMQSTEDPSFIANDFIVHNSAESAVSSFLETQNTYRELLTDSVFTTKLFPIVAVANNLYKKDVKDSDKMQRGQISQYLMHSKNRSKLKLPELIWRKSLEPKGEENTFEMLEQASEKGVPIPLKAWMASAGLDYESLMKDLKGDKELRDKLAQFTTKDTSHEGEDVIGDAETASLRFRPTTQSINNGAIGRRALLAREWGEPELYIIGKTGKKQHIVHNPRGKQSDINAKLAKISTKAHVDEEYRMYLAKRNKEKLGRITIPGVVDNIGGK
jgi:hypothetical protein